MRFFLPLTDTTAAPLDERALQIANRDVGNPAGLPVADLKTRGYAEVVIIKPVFNPATEHLGTPVNNQVGGIWKRTTPVINYTKSQLTARAAAEFMASQSTALIEIDTAAETARLQTITPGVGQLMSYRAKAEEAKACLAAYTAATPPASGVYVLLDSEAGVMKTAGGAVTKDAYQVAVVVKAACAAWLTIESAINRVRVQAKSDIKAATTVAAIDTIMTAIGWP